MTECQSLCNKAQADTCVDAAALSSCRAACTTVPDEMRATFAVCIPNTGGVCTKVSDCVAELLKTPPPPDVAPDTTRVAECQKSCNAIHGGGGGCVDAAGLTSCRRKCASTTLVKRDDFIACEGGTGGVCTKAVDCQTELLK